jgi:hypothetical protein
MQSPPPHTAATRTTLFREWHVEATAFLYEIVRTADALKEARGFDGDPALYFSARWRLLRAIERHGGAPTFAGLALTGHFAASRASACHQGR